MPGVWAFVALFVGLQEVPAPAPPVPVKLPEPAVALRLEVTLRGTLSVTDKGVTVTVPETVLDQGTTWRSEKKVWVLEFEGKKLRKQVKQLDGKVVRVSGTCRLIGVRSVPYQHTLTLTVNPPRHATETGIMSALDVDRWVRVKALEEVKPDGGPPS